MAKRIAFQGDTGETYEVIPSDGAYPGDAITIPELTAKVSGPQGWFEKTDVSDSFSTDGLCHVYRNAVLLKSNFIFDGGPVATNMEKAKKAVSFENSRIIVTDRLHLGVSGNFTLKRMTGGAFYTLNEPGGGFLGYYKLADATPAITINDTYELYEDGSPYQISSETVMVEVVKPSTLPLSP